ncbi:MAG TPA: PadR family transcriptional regulator [Mycobacteriales bacterium]|nr:PadR family transcriptional regulator [Mycobacteriales bacterium]
MRDHFADLRQEWARHAQWLGAAAQGHRNAHHAFGSWLPPFGPPGHGRGRTRGRRGNVRVAILALLAERPMHGYEMIQEIEERSGGMWRPSPGSVYPTLQLLEDEGLITSQQSDGKRLYTLTDAGREQAGKGQQAPWEQFTEGFDWDTMQKLRDSIVQLAMAFKQLVQTGTEAQKAQAAEVLAEARRKLYAILAEDGGDEGSDPDE